MVRPPSTTRIDESMSSVSIDPRMRVRCRSDVRQYPLEPAEDPETVNVARPGWLTA